MAGLVGGIGPESTVAYYRQIVARWRERAGDGSYPPLLIDSIDLTRMIGHIGAGRLQEVTDELAAEVERLARAGAAFGALLSNTPHVVFEALRARAPIPLVSIVEATRDAASARGLRRVGLFGTRFTMQSRFYPETLAGAGIEVALPTPAEQDDIHDRYMNELVPGIFREETRARLVEIARRLAAEEGIGALVLGGTELPLILGDAKDLDLPLLDTCAIHVDAIVAEMLA